jgi:LemA protein
MVSVESYPQLRASENFQQLQRSLNEIEEQLVASRRAYNAAVTDYNNAIGTFPYLLFAGALGFSRRELFEANAEERANPDLGKLFKS